MSHHNGTSLVLLRSQEKASEQNFGLLVAAGSSHGPFYGPKMEPTSLSLSIEEDGSSNHRKGQKEDIGPKSEYNRRGYNRRY